MTFLDRLCRLQSVHVRHRQVHDDDVRAEAFVVLHRGAAVAGFGDHFHVRLRVEQKAQPLPHSFVILDEQHTNGIHRSPRTLFLPG